MNAVGYFEIQSSDPQREIAFYALVERYPRCALSESTAKNQMGLTTSTHWGGRSRRCF